MDRHGFRARFASEYCVPYKYRPFENGEATALRHLLNWIAALSGEPWHLAWLLFMLALANAVFPPIPLESATLLAGFLVGARRGSLAGVIFPAALGMSVGSIFLYGLGRRRGYDVLTGTHLARIFPAGIVRLAMAWFDRYGLWVLFLGKIAPGIGLVAALASGILRYRPAKALPAIVGSNLAFFSLLAFLGRSLGARWLKTSGYLGKVGLVAAAAGLIGGAIAVRRLLAPPVHR